MSMSALSLGSNTHARESLFTTVLRALWAEGGGRHGGHWHREASDLTAPSGNVGSLLEGGPNAE